MHLRILKVTQTYFPYLSKGGPPAKIRAIARALAARGHNVTVLTADRGKAQGEVQQDEEQAAGGGRRQNAQAQVEREASRGTERNSQSWESEEDGVKAIYLRTLQNYRATTINPQILNFCARSLKNYDIVHIYGLYDLLGSTVGWFCRRRGTPYILEPLGMFGPKIRSQRKKNLYRKLVGDALFAGAAAVIATSDIERKELVAGGTPESKVVLRRNGINLDDFKILPERGGFRAKQQITPQTLLIVFVGRLSFIKGLDLLVNAFVQIDSEAHLVIAGPDDEDGCSREVKAIIERSGVGDRVHLCGPLYGEQKMQAFIDADFVVLPSRYESFGNVAAEAVACGTPVLVTDQCGIAPLVKDRAGVVVPCTSDGLHKGLKRLMEDKNLLAQQRAGCAAIASDLSWEGPVETMERLYESLVAPDIEPANVPLTTGARI